MGGGVREMWGGGVSGRGVWAELGEWGGGVELGEDECGRS